MPHSYLTTRAQQQIVPVWNYRELILALGTSESLSARIRAAGYDPPHPKTISGWRYRGRIPGQWVPLLLTWALKSGAIANLDQLLVDDRVPL